MIFFDRISIGMTAKDCHEPECWRRGTTAVRKRYIPSPDNNRGNLGDPIGGPVRSAIPPLVLKRASLSTRKQRDVRDVKAPQKAAGEK